MGQRACRHPRKRGQPASSAPHRGAHLAQKEPAGICQPGGKDIAHHGRSRGGCHLVEARPPCHLETHSHAVFDEPSTGGPRGSL
eukprot:14628325-Alexandrium_andersonii.AAC.1